MKQWLKDAVFYEIYPQSFYDTNGDGIGDLRGIIARLDYIRDLGCNALWINPCFDSPFKDAGYDVRDYKKIAPRYGTNEDAGVLFDLVPGHTSEEHPWFKASCKPGHNEYSDRFIWTDSCFASGDGMPFIGGETERNGTYILNFFKCQPALNYGYGKINQKWQKPTDDPACVATVEAMKDVMRFWLDMGCDGFRVDMASSLVKNDTKNKKYTCKIWRNIRDMLDIEYPEAALIAEWNGPRMSLKNGFDMDFYLNWQGNGYSWLMRNYDGAMDSNPHNIGKAYFCKNSGTGIDKFLDEYLPAYKATHKDGLWCFITCNHDTIRPSAVQLVGCGGRKSLVGAVIPLHGGAGTGALSAAAHQGGRLLPHGLPHADAVGRHGQPRLLHRRRTGYLSACGHCRRCAHRGRPGGRPRQPAEQREVAAGFPSCTR